MPGSAAYPATKRLQGGSVSACQHGKPWTKPTTSLAFSIPELRLQKRARPPRAHCPLLSLKGGDQGAFSWTVRAEPHPHQLCPTFVSTVVKHIVELSSCCTFSPEHTEDGYGKLDCAP
eukprot:1371569-Pyramimonas_sp.AAC.1